MKKFEEYLGKLLIFYYKGVCVILPIIFILFCLYIIYKKWR